MTRLGSAIVTIWVAVTAPPMLVAVTVIDCEPGRSQANATVSLRPAVSVTGV